MRSTREISDYSHIELDNIPFYRDDYKFSMNLLHSLAFHSCVTAREYSPQVASSAFEQEIRVIHRESRLCAPHMCEI